MMQSLRTSPLFSLVVLITLGFFGYIGLMLFGGSLGLFPAITAMGHFSSLEHRIHDLTYAFLFGTAAVGTLPQLWRPSWNVAGQLMALIPWAGFVLAYALGNSLADLLRPPFVPIFGALTFLATLLHPTGRYLISSFSPSRMNWVMLGLVAVAAVPLLALAATNIGFQTVVNDDHAAMGHYAYMAAFSFTVIGAGILASLRPVGWWLTAWIVGLLPALLGIASVLVPDSGSSLGLGWALAAIAWGVVFVTAAELTQETESPTLLGSRGVVGTSGGAEDHTGVGPGRPSTTSTPAWVNVVGIIALVLVLLFGVLPLTGIRLLGGAGGHTPPIQHGVQQQ